jgi:hypothetical protein
VWTSFFDGFRWTLRHTGAAGGARIGNFVSHKVPPSMAVLKIKDKIKEIPSCTNKSLTLDSDGEKNDKRASCLTDT